MLSDRIAKVGASETLRIMAKAKELRAEGFDVINMGVGEPDFPTPENIKAAGKAAIDHNMTKYTPNPGLPELKKAIIEKLKRDNNLDYAPSEIIVSSGAKNSLFNLFMAIISLRLSSMAHPISGRYAFSSRQPCAERDVMT